MNIEEHRARGDRDIAASAAPRGKASEYSPIGERQLTGLYRERPAIARARAAGLHCAGIRRDDAGRGRGDRHTGAAAAAQCEGLNGGAIAQRDLVLAAQNELSARSRTGIAGGDGAGIDRQDARTDENAAAVAGPARSVDG